MSISYIVHRISFFHRYKINEILKMLSIIMTRSDEAIDAPDAVVDAADVADAADAVVDAVDAADDALDALDAGDAGVDALEGEHGRVPGGEDAVDDAPPRQRDVGEVHPERDALRSLPLLPVVENLHRTGCLKRVGNMKLNMVNR